MLAAWDRFHAEITALHAPDVVAVDLTFAQMKAVYVVAAAGSIHMRELAARLGTAFSTTSETVDRLVNLGLLDRVPDPDDRRAIQVRATPAALAQLDRMTELSRTRMRELLLRIPGDEVETVERAIHLLGDAAVNLNANAIEPKEPRDP